ncbi:hypothetical protein EYF80_028233 [Liparis tanakae]|uniref:Uncharacterized protein n=1 Tax=Liparis tanakae TaxID=230148 RepID=A0A4Z2H6G0_9TELE|nr:hypothetical protein EYF80_028233 [Liparis tanakae]
MADGRFGSLADNSLVIRNVTPFDAAMYRCNNSGVYLSVTTDTKVAAPAKRPRNGPGPGREGTAEDAENPPASGRWEVPVGVAVGVVGGAALTLLVVLTVKFCFKNRAGKTAILDPTVPYEATYEEIQGPEPYFENPYDFPSVVMYIKTDLEDHKLCVRSGSLWWARTTSSMCRELVFSSTFSCSSPWHRTSALCSSSDWAAARLSLRAPRQRLSHSIEVETLQRYTQQLALRPVQALLLGGSLEPQGQAGLSQTQNTPVL